MLNCCVWFCVLGRWFQEQGALVVNVNADSEGLRAHETLVFSFQLLNPLHSRKVSRDIRVQVQMPEESGKSAAAVKNTL